MERCAAVLAEFGGGQWQRSPARTAVAFCSGSANVAFRATSFRLESFGFRELLAAVTAEALAFTDGPAACGAAFHDSVPV